MSIRTSQFPGEHAAIFVDGVELEVILVDGEEAVSTLFCYEVTAAAGQTTFTPACLVGRPATLLLRDSHGGERAVHGIVAAAERRATSGSRAGATDRESARLKLTLRPAAFRLALGKDSRVFHDKTAVDIVREVLAEAGVPARFEITSTYAARAYTAQYREATWAFVSRLCEEEGIHHRTDDAGSEGVVVFCDRSGAAPDLPGGAAIRFSPDSGLTRPTEVIHHLGGAFRATASRVSLGSFDPARPALKLGASAAPGDGGRSLPTVHDAPGGGATDPAVLAARAAVLAKAAGSQRSQVVGDSTSARVLPGHILEVTGHPEPRHNRRLFVTRVQVSARKKSVAQDETDTLPPFSLSFRAAPEGVPFHPPRTTPEPVRPGLQSGVVVGPKGSEIHPDDAGQVRVQLHWDRRGKEDERSGKWMRVSQRGTAGSMLLPRVGWTVLTMNEEGSPDAPVVMSRIFDAEHPPPYTLPEARTRTVFKTATSPGGGSWNEIRFEDRSGAEEMLLNASRDMDLLVQNARTERVFSDSSRKVGGDHDLTVGGEAVEIIGEQRDVTISGSDTQQVDGDRDKVVGGSETATVGADRSATVKGSYTRTVGGKRTVQVGVAQIDASLGDIKATAPTMRILVGGLALKVAYRDIVEDVGSVVSVSTVTGLMDMGPKVALISSMMPGSASVGGVLQTIGGAKVEISRKARAILATKSYREMVGGAMSLTSSAGFSDQAGTEWALAAGASVETNGDEVKITAKDKIELVCGQSKLTITPDRVVIHAAAIDLSGASIDAATPRLELNA